MPKNKSAVTRHRIIDACLTNKQRPFPTLEDLARKCFEKLDMDISTSTIEKDLSVMKRSAPEGYDAPIVYNREKGGYAYAEIGFSISELALSENEWDSLRYAAKVLYQYADVPIFKDFKQSIEKIDARFGLQLDINDDAFENYIQFESGYATTGYEWLSEICPAIRSKWLMNISYENIYKKETKTYTLVPYLLKENRNRWYLIAWVENRNDYLTFALDRVRKISITKTKQKVRKDFNSELFLQHSVGIMENDHRPEKVVLQIKEPYNKLIQLEPLHATQKTIKETTKNMNVEITVQLNYELCNKILSMGPYCKVMQPVSLKNQIKQLLDESLQQY
jgi:predicted DNA-binding transcriptional regulator YafY